MSPSVLDLTLEPTVRAREVDVDADIEVRVDSRVTGLGRAGVVLMALGLVGIIAGSAVFVAAYPNTWKGIGVPASETINAVRSTVLSLSAGVTLLLLGASMFFHGRQVLGSGSLEHLSLVSGIERLHKETPPPATEGPIESFTERPAAAQGWTAEGWDADDGQAWEATDNGNAWDPRRSQYDDEKEGQP